MHIDPFLTQSDIIVLQNLIQDIHQGESDESCRRAIDTLIALNDCNSPTFQPTVFTTWDFSSTVLSASQPSADANILMPRLKAVGTATTVNARVSQLKEPKA